MADKKKAGQSLAEPVKENKDTIENLAPEKEQDISFVDSSEEINEIQSESFELSEDLQDAPEEKNEETPEIEQKNEESASEFSSEIDFNKEKPEEKVEAKPEEKAAKEKTEPSKFKQFLSSHKLPIIIAAAVLAVVLAVVITVLIVNRNLVKISNAEDFLEKNTKGKTTYVLKDDVTVTGDLTIPHGMSIDLNKYTLTVNGSLIYSSDAEDREIYIGDRKGPLFLDNGNLVAKTIQADCPLAVFEFHSPVTANCALNVKTVKFANDLTSAEEGSIVITASEYATFKKDVTVKGNVGVMNVRSEKKTSILKAIALNADGGTATLTSAQLDIQGAITAFKINIVNCSDCGISGEARGILNVVGSTVNLNEGSKCIVVISDNLSTINVSGNISLSLTGGLVVNMKSGAVCPLVKDALTLNIYENVFLDEMTGIGDINFFVTLSAPQDIVVNHEEAKIICRVSEVNNAEGYILVIDGTELPVSSSNTIDITAHISQPGTHTIKAKAVSSDKQFMDSPFTSVDYIYNIKLATPSIALDMQDGCKIKFGQVDFATNYIYIINNGDPVKFTDFQEGQEVVIDITDKVLGAGAYTVKIVAKGANDEAFEPSETASISFVRNIKLDKATKDGLDIRIIREGGNLTLSWDKVKNADYYSIYIDNVLRVTTRKTEYIWTLGSIEDAAVIKVIANGHGYYLDSNPATFTYSYETLEAPVLSGGAEGGSITLTWNAVTDATAYIVYLDGVIVRQADAALNYTAEYTPENSGNYTVKAVAEYFKDSVSNKVKINSPALNAPQISFTIEGTTVTITFKNVPHAATYELYKVGETDIKIDTTAETSFTFEYTEAASYYVKATSVGYVSTDSNTILVETK